MDRDQPLMEKRGVIDAHTPPADRAGQVKEASEGPEHHLAWRMTDAATPAETTEARRE